MIDDIQTLKPTIFGSFPLFYNNIVKSIKKRIDGQNTSTKWMFEKALKTKLERLKKDGTLEHYMYDEIVFKKVRECLGGKIRYFVSGGAPMSQEVFDFIKIAFSAPVIQAYGSTETCGCLTSTSIWE